MGEAYPTPAIFLGYVVTKPLAKRRELSVCQTVFKQIYIVSSITL